MKFLAFFSFLLFSSFGLAQDTSELKRVKLAWDEVEDSKSYELEIYKEEVLLLQQSFSALEWQGKLEAASYKYRVRAIDEFDRPGEWTAFEAFTVKNKVIKDKSQLADEKIYKRNPSLGIHVAYGSYEYRNQVSGVGSGKLESGTSLGLGGDLSFWLWDKLGIDLSGTHNNSTVQNVDVSYAEFNLAVKYALFRQSRIFLNPSLSFEYQNTPEFFVDTATLGTLQTNLIQSMGLGLGLEIGTMLSETWTLSAHARYIHPFSLKGDVVAKSSPDSATFYRYALNLQYYWLPQWLLGLELGGDHRELKYEFNNKKQIERDELRLMLFTRYVFSSAE